jgi:propionyl-CoA carboxylase alpha chain
MIKASAGGGGKGIRVAWNRRDAEEGFPAVRAEARGAFGDERIFIEKFIENPRHVEIQVLGDKHGNLVHLFERECSIQRRNQKVIEEAPSPLLDPATRAAMGAQAVALARAVGYDSAGTVEFVAAQDRSFFFLEMNTRLQVEHPVTEMITGVDLVEQMIRSAAGEPLAFAQDDLGIEGWAVESRIYAEDPYRNFLPSIGRLVRYRAPAEGEADGARVRNDTGVREGDEISMFYDPMIAKLAVWGPDRAGAVTGMARALERFEIEGVGHNTPFLSAVMSQARFASGALSTSYIADEFPDGFKGLPASPWQEDVMAAAAGHMHLTAVARGRHGAGTLAPPPRTEWAIFLGGERRAARLEAAGSGLTLIWLDGGETVELTDVDWRPGQGLFTARLNGRGFSAAVAAAAEGYRVRIGAASARVLVLTPRLADLHERLPVRPPPDTSRLVLSPMPGLVISCDVESGQAVEEGQVLFVIEAMKMQNIIRAERNGVLGPVTAAAGDSVAADDVLAEFV